MSHRSIPHHLHTWGGQPEQERQIVWLLQAQMEESAVKTKNLVDATYPSRPLISHFPFQPNVIIVTIIFVKHVSLADDS